MVHYGSELSLPHVSRHDSGVYFCLASNGVPPTVSKKVRLYVDCKITLEYIDVSYVFHNCTFFLHSSANFVDQSSIDWSISWTIGRIGVFDSRTSTIFELLDTRNTRK